MSTKSTIAYDKKFHLYKEMGDPNHIYLELDTNNYEAGYGRVMIPIPVHIWEVIREFPGVRLELADLSDAQLLEKVEKEVDERIQTWKEYEKLGKNGIWCRLAGSLTFGDVADPKAKQIRTGLGYYRAQRKWQREVKAAIEKLRDENTPKGQRKRLEERNRRVAKQQAARKAAEVRRKRKAG